MFNDHLYMDKIKSQPTVQYPRAFDAGRLVIRNSDEDVVKDLTESPCYHEIGFNPDLSQQAILNEYESCESENWQSYPSYL